MWQRAFFVFTVAFLAVNVERSMSFQVQFDAEDYTTLEEDDGCADSCKKFGMKVGMDDVAPDPVKVPSAWGDPHLTNLKGERFDVVRQTVTSLLRFPRKNNSEHVRNDLQILASVEHPGNESACKGFFILRLWVSGSLIGEKIKLTTRGRDLRSEDALGVKIGNTTMRNRTEIEAFATGGKYKMIFTDKRDDMAVRHKNNRVKFASMTIQVAQVALEINWLTGKDLANRLDFRAQHLAKLGSQWGGVLGEDDHKWESSYSPACKKHNKLSHLMGAGDREQFTGEDAMPWQAIADLA